MIKLHFNYNDHIISMVTCSIDSNVLPNIILKGGMRLKSLRCSLTTVSDCKIPKMCDFMNIMAIIPE